MLKDARPFGFAGLWERWRDPAEGEVIETTTIVTGEANELVATIHNRMPVIIDEADHDAWLDPDTPRNRLLALLRPLSVCGHVALGLEGRAPLWPRRDRSAPWVPPAV